MIEDKNLDVRALVKNLKSQEFLSVGVDQIAYVRASEFGGHAFFSVYAADGTPINMASSFEEASACVQNAELRLVTVH